MTLQEAEHIAVEANADPGVHVIERVKADHQVAEALSVLWREHLGNSPVVYPPFDLVIAVETQTGRPVWSWS